MKEYFTINHLSQKNEGEKISIQSDYNPHKFLLHEGNIENQQQEFTITHRGWLADKINLPKALESTNPENMKIISLQHIAISHII